MLGPLKNIFSCKRTKATEVHSNQKKFLQNRAWILHILKTTFFLLNFAFSLPEWEKDPKTLGQYGDLKIDEEMVEKLGTIPKYAIISIIGIGLLLDILCFKYRRLSSAFFYVDCALILAQSLSPSSFYQHFLGETASFVLCVLLFACQCLPSIIIATGSVILTHALINPLFYDQTESTSTKVIEYTVSVILVFVSATLFWVMLHRLLSLHARIEDVKMERDAIFKGSPAGCPILVI